MTLIAKFQAKPSIQVNEVNDVIKSIEVATNEELNFSISSKGKLFKLFSRQNFLEIINSKDVYDKEIPLITNKKEDDRIIFSGNFQTYTVVNMWYIILEIKKKIATKDIRFLFAEIVDLMDCYWAKISPTSTESKFFDQGQPDYKQNSEADLPKLPLSPQYDSPYTPNRLGWLNYWPAPTLKRINFQEHHRSLFHSVQPAANDGLILQITEQPLDFDIADHLRKTVAIYDALPAIGGRDCV